MFTQRAFLGRVSLAPQFRLGSTQAMTDADEGLIGTVQTAIVKFYANGCPPCEEYKPIFNEVADRMGKDILMAEVDIDQSPGLVSKYDIKATPTTVFVATGKELNRVEGKMTTEGLEAMIKSTFDIVPSTPREERPRLIKPDQNEAPIRSTPGAARTVPQGYVPAAPAGPSKALLVAGGIGVVGIVTGALLLAKA